MAVTEVLGESKGEIAVGVLTAVELGLNPNALYGSDPTTFSVQEGQNRFALVGTPGFVGAEVTGPYTQVSSMAASVTETQQPAAEAGIALAAAFAAAGLVRAVKYFGKRSG